VILLTFQRVCFAVAAQFHDVRPTQPYAIFSSASQRFRLLCYALAFLGLRSAETRNFRYLPGTQSPAHRAPRNSHRTRDSN